MPLVSPPNAIVIFFGSVGSLITLFVPEFPHAVRLIASAIASAIRFTSTILDKEKTPDLSGVSLVIFLNY
jgi:hypothetical protein